ncbi:hypothetical protein [Solibacillus sp. FSL K6-1523]|uniref:hypothetical protein n=1 Tax=Solibacillus sp. FSL K6-1523 TaxID=2921471 RepID=UPI0030F6AF64
MVKECEFIEELVGRLLSEKVKVQCNTYEDKDTTYYFGLQSIREDLPQSIKMTNEEIITNLLG